MAAPSRAGVPAPGSDAAPAAYVRNFNRYEFKYIVHERRARAFAAALEGYAAPDAHSQPGGYPVHSIYWDSPELTFFWEKLDGEKYRRKLRFRSYASSADAGGQVFVEIKQRIDRTVQKRRTLLSVPRAQALFGSQARPGPVSGEAAESELRDAVLAEALFLCRFHRLGPKMAVAYRREAFLGVFEHDLRITFDRRLQYDPRALEFGQLFQTGKYILPPDQVVVEIKFNDTVPLWLTRLTQRHEFDLVRMSKYCSAVDAAFFGGQLT